MAAICVSFVAAQFSPAWADDGRFQSGQLIANNGTNTGVPACSACHGASGEGQIAAGIPRLAGFDVSYLERELSAFRNGTRNNPAMTQFAKNLTPSQVVAVSEYYASLPAPAMASAAVAGPEAQGQIIAAAGNMALGIPSCESCHGAQGGGNVAAPPLAGQSAAYITEQLNGWRHGARSEGPDYFMPIVANRLSDSDVASISAYYASLSAVAVPNGSVGAATPAASVVPPGSSTNTLQSVKSAPQ